ncbi:hypothetical protein [Robiginitalea aurantiaca]|uniref:Fibronectin type-III domain-containing protein n=1 Tax=Robiginitalea aurantiaca TaxID=3056915 RepID=A0ABT7WI39_9FLAO|nr:hypothetical protein [Robiginitalea aurantiaca]MDM9632598.1 hypothetical protein [Robiginitalea aurantiaca]
MVIAPGNGQNFPAGQDEVTLVWEANDLDDDILGYDVYFGRENPPPLFRSELTDTQTDPIPVDTGNYFWQIITRDQAGNESISEVFRFTVE